MNYFIEDNITKYYRAMGKWTCKASALIIELSGDYNPYYNPYPDITKVMTGISERDRIYPYVILHKESKFGFTRVERYKELKPMESEFSLFNCHRFSTEDALGCSYMYSCAQIDLNTTDPRIFNLNNQSFIFLGDESNYRDVIAMIPKLKSIESIQTYIIESGMLVIRSEDNCDIGYYLWFVSNQEKIQSLKAKIQQFSMMELH